MKNCQDIQPDLSAYVDGELAPSRRAEIEAHVAACPRCQQELAGLRTLAAGVAALPRLHPAPRFLAEVRRKIAQGREPVESIAWADYLFRPFWLKVPLEAAALIVVALFMVSIIEPRSPEKVAQLKMAQANRPSDEVHNASLYKSLALPVKEAKVESANEIAGESRRRVPVVAGGADGLTITAAPASGVASWAQSLGIDQSKLRDVVTVDAKHPDDVRGRAEQLAAKYRGRTIPAAQSKDATGQVFFVELPWECAAAFKSELLQGSGTNAPAMSDSGGSRTGELTGSVETNDIDRLMNRLQRGVEVKPPSSTTTVLEIRVVPAAL